MFHKVSGIETERKYHDFCSKFFCLMIPKNFVGALFCASEKFWYRDRERVSRFPMENFCLRVSKTFVREPFCSLENSGIQTEGVFTI